VRASGHQQGQLPFPGPLARVIHRAVAFAAKCQRGKPSPSGTGSVASPRNLVGLQSPDPSAYLAVWPAFLQDHGRDPVRATACWGSLGVLAAHGLSGFHRTWPLVGRSGI
jgi:hypothetical protein